MRMFAAASVAIALGFSACTADTSDTGGSATTGPPASVLPVVDSTAASQPPVTDAKIVLPAPTTTRATTPAPTAPRPAVQPTVPAPPETYYANCDAVRAAGAAPINRGEPGYRAGLDRDGDGIACDVVG